MTQRVFRCSRCPAKVRPHQARFSEWNAQLRDGVVVGALCPDCQSTEENAEAAINEATVDYSSDGRGRYRGSPKWWIGNADSDPLT